MDIKTYQGKIDAFSSSDEGVLLELILNKEYHPREKFFLPNRIIPKKERPEADNPIRRGREIMLTSSSSDKPYKVESFKFINNTSR